MPAMIKKISKARRKDVVVVVLNLSIWFGRLATRMRVISLNALAALRRRRTGARVVDKAMVHQSIKTSERSNTKVVFK